MFFGGAILNFKKLTVLCLAICILFLNGCKSKNNTNTSSVGNVTSNITADSEINMLYSSKDTLNPYTCVTSQNKILTGLMFDSLVVLNNNYEYINHIAKSISYKDKVYNIILNDIYFSDGSKLTASDVVFSLNIAKKSTEYALSLKYIASTNTSDANCLTITLSRDDPYFANLLTFPIIKSDSDKLTDSDKRLLPPIGSGRFVFDVENKLLVSNPKHHGGISKIAKINLTDCPDSESVNQTISTGAVDFYFTDMLNNVIPKMNGNSADVPQSRIVFLGINPNSQRLSNVYFRQGVSAAIDREKICKSAYYSKATVATGPYPSNWKIASNLQTISKNANIETTDMNIKSAGFGKKDKNGYYIAKNNQPITLTLLVSSDNVCRLSAARLIKDNLESAGIKINLVSVNNSKFLSELSAKKYDLYLGEIRFHNNLDLGSLVSLNSAEEFLKATQNTSSYASSKTVSSKTVSSKSSSSSSEVASGTSGTTDDENSTQNVKTKDIYDGFYNGVYTTEDVISAFNAELPVIPICFRNGLVIYSNRLGTGITPVISDLFYNIEKIK